MPRAFVNVINAERCAERFRMQPDKIAAAAQGPVARATERIRNRAVEGIASPPKTGIVYEKYQPHRFHQASAAGEYPAGDTGILAGSIYSELDFDETMGAADGAKLTGTIGADAEYAAPLEYKSESDGGRPFLGKSMEEDGDEFFDDMERTLRGVVGPDDNGGSPGPIPAPQAPRPQAPRTARASESNEGQDGFSADDLNRREADRLRGLPPPDDDGGDGP